MPRKAIAIGAAFARNAHTKGHVSRRADEALVACHGSPVHHPADRFMVGSPAMWRRFSALGFAAFLLACQDEQVPELAVAPAPATLTTGQTVQLTVTRQFLGGPIESVTERVTYVPSSPSVSVTPRGLVTAAQPGNVLIRIVDDASDAATSIAFSVVAP
jgi:hypothetical protein